MTTHTSSIAAFCDLLSSLNFSHYNELELVDLNALTASMVEGLSHGLLFIGETLESGAQFPPESLLQLSEVLTAHAHILPALHLIGDKALIELTHRHE